MVISLEGLICRTGVGIALESKKVGIFHALPEEMKLTLLTMAREDAKETRMYDQDALMQQRKEKQRKMEIMKEKGLKKSSERFIDALYYFEMFGSAACWMSSRAVDIELRKLTSKSAKLSCLKENIRIRTLGLGWVDLAIPWSCNGKDLSPEELVRHLKLIIKEQKKRDIPSKPMIDLPKRKELPILGNKTKDLKNIDSLNVSKGGSFEDKATEMRDEREAAGIGDRFAAIQPMSRPTINKQLIGKRLDVCLIYELDVGGTELRWCQGEVILISDGSNILKPGARTAKFKAGEAVRIRWDANIDRNEPVHTTAQRLLPTKWNPKGKHSDGCWRFDLKV